MNNMFGKYLSLFDSLLVTGICMGIVFIVLLVIAYILSLFKYIPKNCDCNEIKKDSSVNNNVATKIEREKEKKFSPEDITDENMLVAMLVASMEAAAEEEGAYIKVKSIKEI